jgi:hypothetical protein
MHTHDHEVPESLRPKGSRLDDPERSLTARAAAEGRWDVVGAGGMAHLQRAASNSAVSAALSREPQDDERSPVHDVVSGAGRPLEPELRSDMEARLGSDFGDVRVHDDGRAHDSAVAVNAHAYTVGSNIVFQRDRYDPSSPAGQETIAHELTHVVQQRNGPVDGSPAAGGIKVSDPGDRFEREASANAARVMSSPAPVIAAPVSPAVQREIAGDQEIQRSVDPTLQRQGEDEEEVQGSFIDAAAQPDSTAQPDATVQREDAEEEDQEAAPAG